jgi:C-terminal processing protease CtpA/Prc
VEDPARIWNTAAFTAFIDEAFGDFLDSGAKSLVIDLRNYPGGDNSFSDPMISWIADRPFRFASQFLVRSSDEAAASNQARLDASPDAVQGVSGRYAEAYRATPRGETFPFEIALAEPREGAKFEGEVYVLVNRNSYSNAVNVASIFQDYGWGEIAGEPTADFATTYGAMEHFTLPNTGFKVGFPKAYIVRPSGDERLAVCGRTS